MNYHTHDYLTIKTASSMWQPLQTVEPAIISHRPATQSKEKPIMSLYEVYVINLATHDTLSELVVADSEAKAHIKAFAQAGLGGTSVDDYHFICKRIGDVPSEGDE